MEKKRLKHASLFTGIGGFDLAAAWIGWQNVFQCEIDLFCQKVLTRHFPQCELFTDIRTSKFIKYHGTIDVITGGFPCQPFSVAGRRKGTDDERYLWHEMLRAIREIEPQWVIAENVYGLFAMQSGMVFERVCADLEDAGYEVGTFIIPACAVDAPHRRDRVWIVAHANNNGRQEITQQQPIKNKKNNEQPECPHVANTSTNTNGKHVERKGHGQTKCANGANQSQRLVADNGAAFRSGNKRIAAHTESAGFKTCVEGQREKQFGGGNERMGVTNFWQTFPTQSPVCERDDGISCGLANIAFSKWRIESIKSLGNAIVPQVAHQIFKAIEFVTS